jgi:predicted DsbA family dithiol-disulfide isomerase
MKVEVWSDFGCPFCYIGKRRFEEALEHFAHKNEVELVFRSFELDPHAERDFDYDVHDMLSAKYGMSRERAIAMNENVGLQAQEVGLTFNFDTLVLTNTFDAHRLAHFAAEQGKTNAMADRLFRAYFTNSEHLGDHSALTDMAAEIGLDRNEAARILASGEYAAEVRADEEEAAKLGIRGVPFFVIDRKYAVSGAQASETFLGALQKAWDESQPLTVLNDTDGDAAEAGCTDDICTPSPERKK